MTIYADAHVHFYRCFDLLRLLSAARDRGRTLDGPLLLLLCESAGYAYFRALRSLARGRRESLPANLTAPVLEAFPPRLTDEPESLRLGDLVLVAGRQLVSSEQVEVLALAADPSAGLDAWPDGAHPARELVERVLESGALAVLPWGVGKWLGARGRRVAELLGDPGLASHPRLFAGDIAQRCWPWPRPAAFERGPRVLPGSDILPVAGAEPRLAGFGLRLAVEADPARPARSLREGLAGGAPVESWGRREGLGSTVVEQLRYRWVGGDRDA
jgi:hypothetical protein